jgi:hypothetical protein
MNIMGSSISPASGQAGKITFFGSTSLTTGQTYGAIFGVVRILFQRLGRVSIHNAGYHQLFVPIREF